MQHDSMTPNPVPEFMSIVIFSGGLGRWRGRPYISFYCCLNFAAVVRFRIRQEAGATTFGRLSDNEFS